MSKRAKKAKHTPGPWTAEDGSVHHFGGIVITASHVGMTSNTPLANVSTLGDEESAWADARLIAAAPDLLEALKGVVAVADRRTPEFDKARAAIAKAS